MIGNLIQVTSKGEVFNSYFHSIDYSEYIFVTKRTTRFSNYVREVITNERVDFGKTITFDIPKLGDLLWKSYIETVLPDLSAKSEQARAIAESRGLTFTGPQFYWVNEIGNHIFERVELLIDGVTITHYSNNYSMIKNQENTNTKTDIYLSEMIGQNQMSVTGEKVIYTPLHFWFTNEIHQALPLFKMENTKIQIRVKTRALDDLVVSNMLLDSRNTETQYTEANAPWVSASLGSNISQPMVKFTGARYFGVNPVDPLLPQIYGYNGINTSKQGRYIPEIDNGRQEEYHLTSCTLICQCFDIGNEEKTLMAEKTYPIYQIQELYYPNQSTRGKILSELVFSNPVAHIHWFYRNPDVIGVFNNYVNLSKNIVYRVSKMPIYPVRPTIGNYQYVNLPPFYNTNAELLVNVKIKITNQDRQDGDADLFRDVVYQTRKQILPSTYEKYIYSYHFGKEVETHKKFSACLNFDKLNRLYLESEFDYNPDDNLNQETNIHILAESLNLLVFSGGKASLLFDSP